MEAEAITYSIIAVIAKTISIYSYILIIRVLLTWFPNLDWSNPILANISSITDPYLNMFRGIIPPLGGLDLSPILAFVVLDLAGNLIIRLGYSLHASSIMNYYQ